MDQLVISEAASHSKPWSNKQYTWGELVQKFSNFIVKDITKQEYADLVQAIANGKKEDATEEDKLQGTKAARKLTAIKNGACYVGGEIEGSKREDSSIVGRSIAVLDADAVKDAATFLNNVERILGDYNYLVHSTMSHSSEAPRFRVVIPLDRMVDSDEYRGITRELVKAISPKEIDACSYKPSQLMYYPSKCSDATEEDIVLVVNESFLAENLPVEEWLAKVPTNIDGRKKKKVIAAATDPSKPDYIRAFNIAYPIAEAMEKFIPDAYEFEREDGKKQRYRRVGSMDEAGFIIHEDGNATTQHGSDPITLYDAEMGTEAAKNFNAFDMVRIHLFGEKDYGTEVKQVSYYPSMKAIKELLKKDKKYQYVLKQLKENELSSDFADTDFDEMMEKDWKAQLDMDGGVVEYTAKNMELILSKGEMEGVLATNMFDGSIVLVKQPPFKLTTGETNGVEVSRANPIILSKQILKRLSHWVDVTHQIKGRDLIDNAIETIAADNEYHPIQYIIESKPWDGVERAERIIIEFLKADDTPYVRTVTRKFLLAAITRLYKPGTKFDHMLIIKGGQGTGKSSLFDKMAFSKYYTDGVDSIDPKSSGELLGRNWFAEVSELEAFRKPSDEAVKAFITRKTDDYRPAYAPLATKQPRRCVILGTTNRDDFLSDVTGNRRFWIVEAGEVPKEENVNARLNFEGTKEQREYAFHYVQQVWAEVLTWYQAGEELLLGERFEEEVEAAQRKYMKGSDMDGEIIEWLEQKQVDPCTSDFDEQRILLQEVCIRQIVNECLNNTSYDRSLSTQIKRALLSTGKWEYIGSKKRFGKYGPQFYFKRIN